MQSHATQPISSDRDTQFRRKARLLLDLLGPSGVEKLKRAGLPLSLDTDGAADNAALSERERDALMARFDTSLPATPSPAFRQVPARHSLEERLAEALDADNLAGEHPAVIATVLRGQPTQVRRDILRLLPGASARATMRYLVADQARPSAR